MKNEFSISHTIHGSIIDGPKWDIGWSRHELEVHYGKNTARILLDAGSKQCNDDIKLQINAIKQTKPYTAKKLKEEQEKNAMTKRPPLFWTDVKNIDGVIISHAHDDHNWESIYLPKEWYQGKIYMHEMTKNLTNITFQDTIEKENKAASINNEYRRQEWNKLKSANEAFATLLGVANTRTKKIKKDQMPLEKIEEVFEKNGLTPQNPLSNNELENYRPEYRKPNIEKKDLMALLRQIKPITYGKEFKIVWNFVKGKFYNAWHINWSAQTLLKIIWDVHKPNNSFNILYTGDIGRFKDPGKEWAPQIPKEKLDYIVMESTYGNRLHPSRNQETRKFIDEINSSKDLVLICCFTKQRMQEVREILGNGIDNWDIKLWKNEQIHFASKLWYAISKEYIMNDSKNLYPYLKNNPKMKWVVDEETGKTELNEKLAGHWRKIVVVSTNGSLKEYLYRATQSAKAKILGTWFPIPWSVFYKLAHNDFSTPIIVNDKIIDANKAYVDNFNFSSHGDQEDLIHFIKNCNLAHNVKISLVHWWFSRYALAEKLEKLLEKRDLKSPKDTRGQRKVYVPKENWETINL